MGGRAVGRDPPLVSALLSSSSSPMSAPVVSSEREGRIYPAGQKGVLQASTGKAEEARDPDHVPASPSFSLCLHGHLSVCVSRRDSRSVREGPTRVLQLTTYSFMPAASPSSLPPSSPRSLPPSSSTSSSSPSAPVSGQISSGRWSRPQPLWFGRCPTPPLRCDTILRLSRAPFTRLRGD